MDDFNPQDLHHAFPLGIGLIGLEDVFAPEVVSAPDEAKDAQGIDVIA